MKKSLLMLFFVLSCYAGIRNPFAVMGVVPSSEENIIGEYSSLRVDGNSANIPYTANWDLTTSFTMSMWVWIDSYSASGFNCIVSDGGVDGWTFYVQNGVGFVFYLGGAIANVYSHVQIPTGEWHMLTVIWDSDVYDWWMYVDGQYCTGMQKDFLVAPQASTSQIILGSFGDGTFEHNGRIDEFVLFNRALSAGEVSSLYSSGDGLYGNVLNYPFDSGLGAGYHFDEGSGTELVDFSLNNNDGVNVSGEWVAGKVVNVP